MRWIALLLKRLKNNALYLLVVATLALLRRLPTSLLLALGRPLGLLAYLVAAPERRRALRNVQAAGLVVGKAAPRALVRRVFVHLGRSAMECVALDRPTRLGGPVVRFAAGAEQVLRDALDGRRGVVFVTAHLGNWELMGALVARVAPLHVLARQSYDPRLTRLMERFRADRGLESIWVDRPGALRAALTALRQGELVGILLDQPVRQGGCRVPFFGRPAPTSVLAASLARSTCATIVVAHTLRLASGEHRVWIERLALVRRERVEDLQRWTGQITERLERWVRRDPAQWLWTLDRWRDDRRGRAPAGGPVVRVSDGARVDSGRF